MLYGSDAYFTSGWNIMDGVLVIISIIDLSMSLLSSSSPRIFGILRVRPHFQVDSFPIQSTCVSTPTSRTLCMQHTADARTFLREKCISLDLLNV